MNMMTEKEAWLFIADAFDKPKEAEPYESFTSNGICWACDVLLRLKLISESRLTTMYDKLEKYREYNDYDTWFWPVYNPNNPKDNLYRNNRAELCRAFASLLK